MGKVKLQQQNSKSNWSIQVKVLRVLWWPFGILFIKGTGKYLSPLRKKALRLFGAKIPGPARVMDGVKVWYPWNLTLLPYCILGRGVEVYNFAPITVGEQSTVSQDTFLCSATHDYTHPHMPLVMREIIIEDQVWIASKCFIGPGVTVSSGCVIGACSVVTKSTEPWYVYAGNPAKKIKPRVIQG